MESICLGLNELNIERRTKWPIFFSVDISNFIFNTKMTFIPDSLNCFPIDTINNDLALNRVVVCRWSGDKQSHTPITAQFANARVRH